MSIPGRALDTEPSIRANSPSLSSKAITMVTEYLLAALLVGVASAAYAQTDSMG
jgi:hypothetical protein